MYFTLYVIQVLHIHDIKVASPHKEYVQELLDSGDYGIRDIFKHEPVLTHHVRKSIKSGAAPGDPDNHIGYPQIHAGEEIPTEDDLYECTTSRKHKSTSTRSHKDIPFLRAASVNATVLTMQNRGLYPVRCTAESMPSGVRWDNFAEVLYTFHAYYCYYEGLALTSDMARAVMLFMFYGNYQWQTRQRKTKQIVHRTKSFLFFVSKKMLNGRSRFVDGVRENFSTFLSLLDKNEKWREFLQDKGEGSPPMEYLIAVEDGLRAYANNIHAMGSHPLRSSEYWRKVDTWRKREAYIAVVRHVLSKPAGYRNWSSFLFSDYVQRQDCGLTFKRRHLPLSNGDDRYNFAGKYSFKWSEHVYVPRKKMKKEPTHI